MVVLSTISWMNPPPCSGNSSDKRFQEPAALYFVPAVTDAMLRSSSQVSVAITMDLSTCSSLTSLTNLHISGVTFLIRYHSCKIEGLKPVLLVCGCPSWPGPFRRERGHLNWPRLARVPSLILVPPGWWIAPGGRRRVIADVGSTLRSDPGVGVVRPEIWEWRCRGWSCSNRSGGTGGLNRSSP
jgi:hypothetical protein